MADHDVGGHAPIADLLEAPSATVAREVTAAYPDLESLFRDHYECFLVPPLDEWFGFGDLVRTYADAGAKIGSPREAVAAHYAAIDHGRFSCGRQGAGPLAIHAALHVRLGDTVEMNMTRGLALITWNSIRVAHALQRIMPNRDVRLLILTDSPPEKLQDYFETKASGIDVVIERFDERKRISATIGKDDFAVDAEVVSPACKCLGDPLESHSVGSSHAAWANRRGLLSRSGTSREMSDRFDSLRRYLRSEVLASCDQSPLVSSPLDSRSDVDRPVSSKRPAM